jgi:hypothetical protein
MTAAARQKRYRQRQRCGEAVYAVVAGEEVFAALCDAGLLADRDCDDRAKVGHAMARALAEWASAKADEKIVLRVTRDRLGTGYFGTERKSDAG